MSNVSATLDRMLRRLRSSEWSKWGKYRSWVEGELHRTNYPGFKFDALRRDAMGYRNWKAMYSAAGRREAYASAQKFTKWWWKLPPSYRIGSAVAGGLVAAFGLNVTTAIIHAGQRLIYWGKGPDYVSSAYNEMEGLAHSSEERSQSRENLTDFGSGWQHGTTIKVLRNIFKDRAILAKISGHAAHVGPAVWLERVAKEQVGYWPGRLSGMMSPRPKGVVFEFPSFMEKTAGADIHTAKGILRIHKDIPIRLANKVIVPSHPRMWQRILENAGLGHIKVEQLAKDAPRGVLSIQPKFTPPPAPTGTAGRVIGSKYSEVKAAQVGLSDAMQEQTIEHMVKKKRRELAKLVPHNPRNEALRMHDKKIQHNIIDDIGKVSHLFNL